VITIRLRPAEGATDQHARKLEVTVEVEALVAHGRRCERPTWRGLKSRRWASTLRNARPAAFFRYLATAEGS
jgi:hypothetical protein